MHLASSTHAGSARASVFGKVPASAEFLRIRTQGPSGVAVQDFLVHAHERLVASGLRLAEPVYFAIGVPASASFAVGAIVESGDSVGRAFPLAVFAEVSTRHFDEDLGVLPIATQSFWEGAGELASRARGLASDAIDAASLALPSPLSRIDPARAICAEARRRERSRTFLERCFADAPAGAPHYAIATLYRALSSQERSPPVVDFPVSIDVDLFAWFAIVGGLLPAPSHASAFFTIERPRLLVSTGPLSSSMLAHLARADAQNGVWPLRTSVARAAESARDSLAPSVRTALERDESLGGLLDAIVRGRSE